jgi:hypothetical protein
MGLPFSMAAVLWKTNAIGLGRPAIFHPATTLARHSLAGLCCVRTSSLNTLRVARAGGGFFFSVLRAHGKNFCPCEPLNTTQQI